MNPEPAVWAIVPASGIGSRMQSETAKQYLTFQGKTILEHTLDRLFAHPLIAGAVLVLRDDDSQWEKLEYAASKPLFIASGGEQRHHSVYSGLTTLQYRFGNDALVVVHDAVRPLVTLHDLDRVIQTASDHEAGAILASPISDTLKLQGNDLEVSGTISRDRLWRALTPQVFHLQPLLNALKKVIDEGLDISDDASALELMGYAPILVEGEASNIKITRPQDLALAESIWLYQRDQQDDK